MGFTPSFILEIFKILSWLLLNEPPPLTPLVLVAFIVVLSLGYQIIQLYYSNFNIIYIFIFEAIIELE